MQNSTLTFSKLWKWPKGKNNNLLEDDLRRANTMNWLNESWLKICSLIRWSSVFPTSDMNILTYLCSNNPSQHQRIPYNYFLAVSAQQTPVILWVLPCEHQTFLGDFERELIEFMKKVLETNLGGIYFLSHFNSSPYTPPQNLPVDSVESVYSVKPHHSRAARQCAYTWIPHQSFSHFWTNLARNFCGESSIIKFKV